MTSPPAIKTYSGESPALRDCFLTLELLINDIDTADLDEPYDLDGAVTSLNIIIETVERYERSSENRSALTQDMHGNSGR